MHERFRVEPEGTLFVVLSFEGPDVYSQAGGLGVRVKELSRALAQDGHETHLYFVGDPSLPGSRSLLGGRLVLHRWQQWLSRRFPGGVYEGEEAKVREWNASLPAHLVDHVLEPALRRGLNAVVMGEEWHTTWSMDLVDGLLRERGIRERAAFLWNANNVFGFERVDWNRLGEVATVTTVSRYMKQLMRDWGQHPVVIPNGIPRRALRRAPAAARRAVREAAGKDLFCFKIGRFDPGKRWLMAIEALADLRDAGVSTRLLMRGGREPHGAEVMAAARRRRLRVADVPAPEDEVGLVGLLRGRRDADVLNLVTFLPERLLPTIYGAADAVLANSGHEPFGLVGLEVMAAGGVAVTGSTGEDYAEALRNAVVIDTDDPGELAAALRLLLERPALGEAIRARGRRTARDYLWGGVLDQLRLRAEYAGDVHSVREGEGRQGTGSRPPWL
ncbi:MAG: glycosyltransferase family 4 protein [Candidatus Dormibacterales bacterium]